MPTLITSRVARTAHPVSPARPVRTPLDRPSNVQQQLIQAPIASGRRMSQSYLL